MAATGEQQQDEDAAELTFPKEFENAETLLISEVIYIYLELEVLAPKSWLILWL